MDEAVEVSRTNEESRKMASDATDKQREAAIERLNAKRAFQANIVSFLVVNAFLIGIWAVSGAGFFWPVFVILGWGFGLVMHGWQVYAKKGITEDDVQREMQHGRDEIA
ncbi:MAG: 2TM domain-containing protein [Acidimicrobiia bacterium]